MSTTHSDPSTLPAVSNWYPLQIRHSAVASASRQNRANAAAVVSIPVEELSDAERQEVAHNIGYRKIGKPVPKDITLSTIVKSMPSEVYCRSMTPLSLYTHNKAGGSA